MSGTVAPAEPIHFRPEGASGGASVGAALLVALVLLGAATAGLAWAKRKGWLQTWTTGSSRTDANGLRISAKLRLSPRTVLYAIETEQGRLHVVESTVRVVVKSESP